ncbi:MAG: hypothetical protein ABIP81_08550 [Terriglobales bacterium]
MTTLQLLLMIGFYLALFVAAAYLTRANLRRIWAALAGGAVFGIVGVLAVALGEAQGWWHVPHANLPYFQLLLWLGLAVSCSPAYLIAWRIVRRFGGRGFAACVLVSTMIGPPRDYWIAAMFPAWMSFAPGIAPVLADGAIYALLVIVGYGVMYWVAGPAGADALAPRRSPT